MCKKLIMENNQTFEEFYSTEGIRFIPDTNSHWHKEFMRFAWMSGYAKRQQEQEPRDTVKVEPPQSPGIGHNSCVSIGFFSSFCGFIS